MEVVCELGFCTDFLKSAAFTLGVFHKRIKRKMRLKSLVVCSIIFTICEDEIVENELT